MYERCLLEAERLLAADRDVIVPVKKLWEEVMDEGKRQGFEVAALPDFTALLEGDRRFEFLPVHGSLQEDLDESQERAIDEETQELEQLGFYAGDRVKLRRIELTPEIVGGIIRSKVDRTLEALHRAWEQRPDEGGETEEKLKEILERAEELRRDVREAFSEDRMKELSRAIRKSRPKRRTPAAKVKKRRPPRSAKHAPSARNKRRRAR